MATSIPTLSLLIPTGGVRRDQHPTEVAPTDLVSAENWLRWKGRFRTRPGLTKLGSSVGQRMLGLIQYAYHDHSSKIVVGTDVGWWRFDISTEQWVDITGTALTGSPTNQVVFRTFSKSGVTTLLGVNGKDSPKKWDGAASTYVAVGGSPPIARCMMTLADRILLGNLSSGATTSPVAIDVSANKDYDSGWGAVLTAILATTPGEIVAMQEMGFLQGAILKEDSIELAIAQDGLVPFRFEFKQRVPGPVSPTAVATIADGLIAYLGQDGAVRVFDGVAARSVGLNVQRQIADTWSVASRARAWLTWHAQEQAIIIGYVPVGGSDPTQGIIIRWPELACYPIRWASIAPTIGSVLDIPTGLTIGELTNPIGTMTLTLGELDTTVSRLTLGSSTGQSYKDDGGDDDGVAFPAHFETGLSSLGGRTWKTVPEIEHFFEPTVGSQPVNVRVGISDYGEPRQLVEEAGSYNVGGYDDDGYGSENALELQDGGPWWTQHRITSRMLALRMEAEVRETITWLGSDASVVQRGDR